MSYDGVRELAKRLRNGGHISLKKLLSKKNSKFNIDVWKVFNKLIYEIYIITQTELKLSEFDNRYSCSNNIPKQF